MGVTVLKLRPSPGYLRFKMFRLSSSSTAGLWLSRLRKNTRITFWTILTPYKLLSLSASYQRCCRAASASDRREPRDHLANSGSPPRLLSLLQHFNLHIGKKKSGCALDSTFPCRESKSDPFPKKAEQVEYSKQHSSGRVAVPSRPTDRLTD